MTQQDIHHLFRRLVQVDEKCDLILDTLTRLTECGHDEQQLRNLSMHVRARTADLQAAVTAARLPAVPTVPPGPVAPS